MLHAATSIVLVVHDPTSEANRTREVVFMAFSSSNDRSSHSDSEAHIDAVKDESAGLPRLAEWKRHDSRKS
jgi:hypothetical protein